MQTEVFSMSTPAAYAAMAAMLGRPITRCPPARACALSDGDIWDLLQSPPRPAAPRGGDLVVLAAAALAGRLAALVRRARAPGPPAPEVRP